MCLVASQSKFSFYEPIALYERNIVLRKFQVMPLSSIKNITYDANPIFQYCSLFHIVHDSCTGIDYHSQGLKQE